MGKKQFIKDAKSGNKKSKQPQAPTTADEYLEAGVEFEEAGEKWRGGDAAKSARFFTRAIDAYDEGLRKFPGSFDLAYNKARVQYELTQHPKLAAHLPGPLLALLETSLQSSRYALSLKQDNADVLFNTAQILTSLVEAVTDARSGTLEPIPLLEESIELFQRCIALQEYQLTESLSQAEQASAQTTEQDKELQDVSDTEEGGVSISEGVGVDSQSPQDTQWATIVEPVTNDTLLDTLLAQLEPLTLLCTLITNDEGQGLAWIEEYTGNLLNQKLPIYVQSTGREQEASLVRANFVSALAEANFRAGRIDIQTYQSALEDAFGSLDIANDPKGLVDKAEALISYNTAIRNADEAGILNLVRWKSITTALECLTNASKLPTASNLSKIHIARGDAELLRYRLGQPPSNYDIATKNGATLLKNAEKFYRGAGAVARAEGETNEISEAVVKEALTKALGGDAERWTEILKEEKSRAQEVVQDAVDDGLIFIDGRAAFGFV